VASARKIEDEAEALRCLREAKRSGRALGQWARAHGIDGRSLHAWSVNLARRGTTAVPRRRKPKSSRPGRALVELVPTSSSGKPATPGRYVLEVAGARLEFDDHCSVATLRRVLEALRPC
jgi:transposase-like protein